MSSTSETTGSCEETGTDETFDEGVTEEGDFDNVDDTAEETEEDTADDTAEETEEDTADDTNDVIVEALDDVFDDDIAEETADVFDDEELLPSSAQEAKQKSMHKTRKRAVIFLIIIVFLLFFILACKFYQRPCKDGELQEWLRCRRDFDNFPK